MNDFSGMRSRRSLGQVFLVNDKVASIEAAHATGKTVLEIGPGQGILTRALCSEAKKVIAVEKDFSLYTILKHERIAKNLVLINKDFLDITDSEIGLGKIDIVISNIPYYLSSSVIGWLAEKNMQAVLCLQKEFVEHMLAEPDTPSYSKLSVFTSLLFRVTKIISVPKGSFRPIPKVDSVVIYMKPTRKPLGKEESRLMGLIMQHKKKTVRNAIIDSRAQLGIDKEAASALADKAPYSDQRVFKLTPDRILEIADGLRAMMSRPRRST